MIYWLRTLYLRTGADQIRTTCSADAEPLYVLRRCRATLCTLQMQSHSLCSANAEPLLTRVVNSKN